jgi:hypothetical protein
MIVGMTGTSKGMSAMQMEQMFRLFAAGRITAVHHGDCVGADAEFHHMAVARSLPIILHPPQDDKARAFCEGATIKHKPQPYMARNHDIVDAADVLWAFPRLMREELRSGTWATVRYARRRGKPIIIVWPNGETDREG